MRQITRILESGPEDKKRRGDSGKTNRSERKNKKIEKYAFLYI